MSLFGFECDIVAHTNGSVPFIRLRGLKDVLPSVKGEMGPASGGSEEMLPSGKCPSLQDPFVPCKWAG